MNQTDVSYPNYDSEQSSEEIMAQLQQKVEGQAYQLQEQRKQIQSLEERLIKAQFSLDKVASTDERFIELKKELLTIIEEQSSRRQQNFKESDTVSTIQLENQTKAINELRRELDKTHRFEEQIAIARIDFERLNKEISTLNGRLNELNKLFNERAESNSYMADQRRIDTQRIAELQAELPKLQRKIEADLLAKIQLIERQIPQFGEYQLALEKIREEGRRDREHTTYQIAERERQIKSWAELAKSHEEQMNKYDSVVQKYAEHYQANKRVLETLQDFQERLQREQHQATELQRLAEERYQAAFEKWKADYEQRLKQRSSEWKPGMSDIQRVLDILQKQMEEVQKFQRVVGSQVDMILQILEEDIHYRTTAAQDWQRRFEEIASAG